jgi:glycosyltransferase involved in cell wall biosynthesis
MGAGIVLSQALQKLGVESRVLATKSHPFGFKEDFLFPQKPRLAKAPLARRIERSVWRKLYDPIREPIAKRMEKSGWKKFYDFDILHSHDSHRLPGYVLDHWKGAFVQHYHGFKIVSPLYTDVLSFTSLPNVIKVIPDATWVPLPVDTTYFKPEKTNRSTVSIGYSCQNLDPTKSSYIPIKQIDSAIKALDGKAVSYPLTGIIPRKDIKEYYKRIDVWVDRIGQGFYGFAAVEVASMGIPVVTQIGEEEKGFVPDCPFINTEHDGVAHAIRLLVEDDKTRKELGKEARDFVLRKHDAVEVAKICLKKYEELMQN